MSVPEDVRLDRQFVASEPGASRRFVDSSGTWLTEDGWTRRERDGKPTYIVCSACEAPVDRVESPHGWCDECKEIADAD